MNIRGKFPVAFYKDFSGIDVKNDEIALRDRVKRLYRKYSAFYCERFVLAYMD